ncbi:MAG TPA: fibronectin type III domain-containing protein, partial [Nocardioides sp.]|uniref:fibronectin type III domain-containing protein n=1 Tax=Nocardioides sp. TaxID=35761 RepID=UPI002B644853
ARATGTARVAVAPPASPPRPLALPDTLTVEPGRTATVDPLANDVIAAGDRVVVELVQPPAGVRLASPTGPVTVATPGGAPGRTVEVVYRLSNGLESSQATVTVRTAAPYNNPPVVFDAFGRDTPAPTVRMDVLSAAYDPDGPSSGLRVTDVTAPPGTPVSVSRGRITVTKAAQPTVLAFRVEDADGGAAMAQLFVPGRVAALPTVKPDARISLAPGESLRARLSDYVDNPAGSAVRFTAADAVTGSPAAGVEAQVTGSATFSVRATPGYTGPGAVSFVVTDKGANTPGAQRVVLTVPVQVGSSAPVLRCPTDPVTVPQGGSIALDVGVMCNVYTPDPADRFGLSYSAEWAGPVAGLTLATRTGNPLVVSADPSARVGREGLLLVRAGRSEPDRLRVRVGGAGAPALSPIQISDLKAGETRRVDLASHFTAGVATPRPTVVQVARLAGTGVEVTPVGGSTVLVRADARASGHAEFRIVMSDAGPTAQRARLASNVLSLDLLSVPETPRPPVPGAGVRNGEVHLTWAAPRANGASIDSYEVRVSDGSSRRCATTSCDITGLTNGRSYRFSVRAHNAVGWSDPSAPSRSAQPDAVPGPVGQIRLTKQGDGALTIAWSPPQTVTSHVHKYLVTWRGGGRGFSTGPSFIATGLDNDKTYRFTVYAINDKGMGEGRTSSPFQSAGRPGRPAAPTIADTPSGSGDTATLTVTWPEVEANGPYPVLYTLSRNGVGVPQCQGVPTTSCTIEGVPYDGRTYSFAVGAYAGRNYSQGPAKGWQAVARPAEWGRWTVDATGVDGQARADFVVPSSRGRRSDVSIWVDGVQRFFRSDLSGAVSRTFSVGDNDGPHTVWLRVCNEKGESDGGCTDSSRLQVQTYGPLETYHILAIRSVVDGTRLRWEVDVDTNGAPASVLLESSARPDLRFTLTGVDRQTVRTEFLDLGYSAREEVRITLFDDSERDRGPVLKRAVDTTPDPPDPVVQVRRGSLCSDDPASPLPRCHPPGAGPDCVDPSCGFVELVPAHFLSPVTCDLTVQGGAGDVTTVGPIPDDAPFETSFYVGSPGDWVRAECHDASGTRSDDDRYTWPG